MTTDDVMRELRGRAPGDPRTPMPRMIAIDSSVLIDLLGDDERRACRRSLPAQRACQRAGSSSATSW